MNEDYLKLILAQQVVLLKRIEKLEQKINGTSRMAPISSYQQELERAAMKIINQIKI